MPKVIYKESSSWKDTIEKYNVVVDYDDRDFHQQVSVCTRNLNICEECNSVYEYASAGSGTGGMRVYKYSQLLKLGFEVKTCQHCQDSTTPVEYY